MKHRPVNHTAPQQRRNLPAPKALEAIIEGNHSNDKRLMTNHISSQSL